MPETIKIPTTATLKAVESEKVLTVLTFHVPQIVGHLAFVPIESRHVDANLLKTIGLIEEFKLEQDIIVSDSGNYSNATYQNKTDKNVIVPPATHLKGGHQNRGNNQTEILSINREKTIDVNCFEPGRGSGGDRFTEFEDTPADVARTTMNSMRGYDGSWGIIRDYTNLVNHRGGALADFNEATVKERASHALNFETVKGQTGVAVITRDLSMVEIFPTANTFNIYRERLLRGKVASLFYRLSKQEKTILLPSEIVNKLNDVERIVKSSIEQTASLPLSDGLLIGRSRKNNKAIDVILSDNEGEKQLAYLFGAW